MSDEERKKLMADVEAGLMALRNAAETLSRMKVTITLELDGEVVAVGSTPTHPPMPAPASLVGLKPGTKVRVGKKHYWLAREIHPEQVTTLVRRTQAYEGPLMPVMVRDLEVVPVRSRKKKGAK